ncbi:hypothetical protein Tco_0213096 [Tanacetum coccineum]
MGLWYPKDSGFELTAFSDADHAGCLDTRKSTSGGIQFLGDKLLDEDTSSNGGFNYNKIPLYCDSQSAIAILCNPVQHSRTKHIHTRTEYQLADMFTKALPEDRFKYLVRRIGMRCLSPAELEVVRLRINPMIQPEPEDLPKDNPKLEIAVLRYSQWRSRFLRYIDTKGNGEYLRKCIFEGPYKLTSVVIEVVAATVNSLEVPEHDEAETIHNMSEENKLYFKAEKEAIFLLLTGIGDEIYSTVDAYNTANEIWIAIERLQQGESLNVQDVKTNLFWEFGKFTSRDGESMESYYSRFYKLMNELKRNNLQVTTMQVNVQFLQQLQPEWSSDERNSQKCISLVLLAAAQPYSDDLPIKHQKKINILKAQIQTSSSTKQSASTRHKGKEVVKPITPQSEPVSKEDSDHEQLKGTREC